MLPECDARKGTSIGIKSRRCSRACDKIGPRTGLQVSHRSASCLSSDRIGTRPMSYPGALFRAGAEAGVQVFPERTCSRRIRSSQEEMASLARPGHRRAAGCGSGKASPIVYYRQKVVPAGGVAPPARAGFDRPAAAGTQMGNSLVKDGGCNRDQPAGMTALEEKTGEERLPTRMPDAPAMRAASEPAKAPLSGSGTRRHRTAPVEPKVPSPVASSGRLRATALVFHRAWLGPSRPRRRR